MSTNQIFLAFSSSNVKSGLRAELVFLILCSKSQHNLNPFSFRTWPFSHLTVYHAVLAGRTSLSTAQLTTSTIKALSTFSFPASYPTQHVPLPSLHHLLPQIHDSSRFLRCDVCVQPPKALVLLPCKHLTPHTLLLIIILQLLCQAVLHSFLQFRSASCPLFLHLLTIFPDFFLPKFNLHSNFTQRLFCFPL